MKKRKALILRKIIYILIIYFIVISCKPKPIEIDPGDHFRALPKEVLDPVDNPRTPEKIHLGKMLFWDPILSGNKDIACVSCHHPSAGYAENLDLPLGVGGTGLSETRKGGTLVKRNAPTIINSAFNGIDNNYIYDPANTVLFWDNRSFSLEDQALGPIHSEEEMRGTVYSKEDALDSISNRLKKIPEYVKLFNAAFGSNVEINGTTITKAIAAFERTLIAPNSRFDQYIRGDESALTSFELRGMQAFIRAKCNACHNGPMFSDFELHDLGVEHNKKLSTTDRGIEGKFRTPTLRNLTLTWPYMHNGVHRTLESAVGFYNRNAVNDADAEKLNFEAEHAEALVAFIKTLNDESYDKSIPKSVPSGLPVGGNIK